MALADAWVLIKQGDAPGAVARVQALNHLGQSFASKQIRFLAPNKAVILDKVIRTGLGYAETVDGYKAFLADCEEILRSARSDPRIGGARGSLLRICDVEAALFSKLQNY
jgi:hypothetical protein